MKKIVFITTISTSLNFFKGQLNFLSSYFDVWVISSDKEELAEIACREKIKSRVVVMKRPISVFNDCISLVKLVYTFFCLQPEIVHGNTPKAALLSMLAAFFCRVPHRVYMCHGLRFQAAFGIKRRVLILMEKITCACATRVICVSKGVLNTICQEGICNDEKAIVLKEGSANGIDINYYNPENYINSNLRDELGLVFNDFVFCFIGRVVKDKGICELLDAFISLNKICSNTKLLIIGNQEKELDPVPDEYIHLMLTNPNIKYLGVKNDVRPFLAISDTLVLPSYREGFGLVLMEAGAMNVPCIASNIIGCNNVIIENVNGLLVPPKSYLLLQGAMREMYENSDIREKIKKSTRNSIIERFEQRIVWEAMLKEYQSMV